jgi:tetratricopeptide (TPR) repeat protein
MRQRLQGQIASLRARMKGMTDDEPGAFRDYSLARRQPRATRDLDSFVTATTFSADMLRSRGRYREALARLDEIFEDNELYARSWARFYRGAIVAAMGELRGGLAELRKSEDVARGGGNHQAVAWTMVMIGNYERACDLAAAQRALDECERAIDAYQGPMFQQVERLEGRKRDPYYPLHTL